jgi:hypothetical protein
VTKKITIYRTDRGHLSLYDEAGAQSIQGELAEGYMVSEGLNGCLMVHGAPGQIGMSVEQAIVRKILKIAD